ncbi:hypothetical protein ACQKHK_12655 [Staphylococcus capitis]|uniref:hypothetical protein n=1 Tax=Staphylococcus capitis TaxID=29388 RepID=UPI003D02E5F0
MSDEMDAFFEQKLANMTSDEFDALVLRTRPPQESTDPKERAAAALRRDLGVHQRGRKPSKEAAADALRRWATNR